MDDINEVWPSAHPGSSAKEGTAKLTGKSNIKHFHGPGAKGRGTEVACIPCSGRSESDWEIQRALTPMRYQKTNPNHADWNDNWGPMPKCSHFTKEPEKPRLDEIPIDGGAPPAGEAPAPPAAKPPITEEPKDEPPKEGNNAPADPGAQPERPNPKKEDEQEANST